MRNYLLTSVCSWLLLSCSWFCLWAIANYFIMEPELAILLFPFALRLGVTLHTPKAYWPVVYGAEWWLTIGLALLLDQPQWFAVLAASMASIPVVWVAHTSYRGSQWQRLCVMGAVILATALINVVAINDHGPSLWMILLVSITGGLMLVPACYLVWSYLFQSTWIPLTANLVSRSIELRYRHVLLYTLLFLVSIALQIGLPEELRRFAPFCLAIPIILLAFRYGWQGALLGTLLNSVALIAARSGVSELEVTDLLLSLSAQSLTGILLGIAIQRQRDLNCQLRFELGRNHNLSRQLVRAEESVRRNIARELHDEIGQNITAIRTQASILKRVESSAMGERCAGMIEDLSLNIYDTTKGLLTQLRPKTLDDLGLEEAIMQLTRDLECQAHGIDVDIDWQLSGAELSDAAQVTLYRICQEGLNNVVKYANANQVTITLEAGEQLQLSIEDDGIGFHPQDNLKGFGLRGMRERVQALGGRFVLDSRCAGEDQAHGTRLFVVLPRL